MHFLLTLSEYTREDRLFKGNKNCDIKKIKVCFYVRLLDVWYARIGVLCYCLSVSLILLKRNIMSN